MTLLLLAVVVATLLLVATMYARSAMVLIATLGFLTYSVPALVGRNVTVGIASQRATLIDTSDASILAMALAWLGYLAVLGGRLLLRRQPGSSNRSTDTLDIQFVRAAALISAVIFVYMMVVHGPLFFLNSRSTLIQALSFDYLMWRWVNIIGLVAAILARSKIFVIAFAAMIFVNLLIGDRTMIVIALFCAIFLHLRVRPVWSALAKPGTWLAGTFALLIVFFAKPFYVSVKSGLPLGSMLAGAISPASAAASFEPFATHYILDQIIAREIQVKIGGVVVGVLSQFLIVPSMFGFDSSAFNVEITQALYNSRLTYGIAANFWAQGYALVGYPGVFIFGMLLSVIVLGAEKLTNDRNSAIAIFGTVVGVLASVYIYRNSIENYFSFVRQIAIAVLAIHLLARALALSSARGDRKFASLR